MTDTIKNNNAESEMLKLLTEYFIQGNIYAFAILTQKLNEDCKQYLAIDDKNVEFKTGWIAAHEHILRNISNSSNNLMSNQLSPEQYEQLFARFSEAFPEK